MTDETHHRLLWQIAHNLADDSRFMAYTLARTPDPAAALGIDNDQLACLALCKRPRHGSRYRADMTAIAAYVGVDPDRLAALLH